MEKQKVKIGVEHFRINLSGMKRLIVFYILKATIADQHNIIIKRI